MTENKPKWEGRIKGYAINQIKKNLWRMTFLGYEFEDLLHESYICFRECRKEYPDIVSKHFMALYKTSLHNKFYDIAFDSTKERKGLVYEREIPDFESQKENLQGIVEERTNTILRQAPEEVKTFLSLIFNSPSEILEMSGFMKLKSKGFFNNKKICELLGYDSKKINLIKMLREYLS